jgi:hypothetical protein
MAMFFVCAGSAGDVYIISKQEDEKKGKNPTKDAGIISRELIRKTQLRPAAGTCNTPGAGLI